MPGKVVHFADLAQGLQETVMQVAEGYVSYGLAARGGTRAEGVETPFYVTEAMANTIKGDIHAAMQVTAQLDELVFPLAADADVDLVCSLTSIYWAALRHCKNIKPVRVHGAAPVADSSLEFKGQLTTDALRLCVVFGNTVQFPNHLSADRVYMTEDTLGRDKVTEGDNVQGRAIIPALGMRAQIVSIRKNTFQAT